MKTFQPPHNPCTQHSFCLINCFALSIGTFGALKKSHHVNRAAYVQGRLIGQPDCSQHENKNCTQSSTGSRSPLWPRWRRCCRSSGGCGGIGIQLGLRFLVVLLALGRGLAPQCLLVVPQRDDSQQVLIAERLGALLQPLAATIGVSQILRDCLFCVLGLFLLALQRHDLIQQIPARIGYC